MRFDDTQSVSHCNEDEPSYERKYSNATAGVLFVGKHSSNRVNDGEKVSDCQIQSVPFA